MKTLTRLIHQETNGTASFDSGERGTGVNDDAGVQREGPNVASDTCRFTMNVTGFAGTSMAVDVVAVIGGVDIVLGSFTTVVGTVQESIVISGCPSQVKIVGTATAVTDFDATFHSSRLV